MLLLELLEAGFADLRRENGSVSRRGNHGDDLIFAYLLEIRVRHGGRTEGVSIRLVEEDLPRLRWIPPVGPGIRGTIPGLIVLMFLSPTDQIFTSLSPISEGLLSVQCGLIQMEVEETREPAGVFSPSEEGSCGITQ